MKPIVSLRIPALALAAIAGCAFAQPAVTPDKRAALKTDIAGQIDGMKKQAQVMVDTVFSFGELGFQEFETSNTSRESWRRRAFTLNAASRASPPRGWPPGDRANRSFRWGPTSMIFRKLAEARRCLP